VYVFWFIWFGSITLLMVFGLGFAATIPLMRRRTPDTPDNPLLHHMLCEDVTFPSRDGLTLGGWWIPAKETARGTVIMCPGQNGSMDKDVPQARPLHEAGFNVLMFDFRAHGRSEGEMVTFGVLEQHDLRGAIDYVVNERGVERVGVFGFSMGAAVGLMTAAQDDRIAALAVDGAYPRLSGILTVGGRLRGLPGPLARGVAWLVLLIGSLRARYQLYRASPIDLAEGVRVPVLLIHGDLDPFVSSAEIESLVARIPGPTDLWRVFDAGHREAFKNHPDDYNRRVVAWFEKHLAERER
jgi:dipeptidyl aminopeptidase/acylaminoacyl peptidase